MENLNTITTNPLVSIIIPVYNGSNYLREAIESALSQTYKNTEVIVVNDGSKDDEETDAIALSYGEKIRYFIKENGGVATALNMGIEHMKGEYFSWLSHDDVYYPEKIQSQIEYLKTYGDDFTIVYSDFDIIDSESQIIRKCVLNHDLLVKKPLYGILRTYIHGCSLLIPKKAFTQYGVFDVSLKFTQDYDLWLRLSKHYTFIHIDKTLIQSRHHSEQDSKKHWQEPKEGNIFWSKCVEGLEDKDILKCENSKVLFYAKMACFLKGTPYLNGYNRSKELSYKENPLLAFLFLQYYSLEKLLIKTGHFLSKRLEYRMNQFLKKREDGNNVSE